MSLKEFTAEIATRSNSDEATARRVIKGLFDHLNEKMDNGEDVVIPQFCKIVAREAEGGEKRFVLRRRSAAE